MPGFTSPFDPWGASEMTPERELDLLKAQAHQLQEELSTIEKRVQELGEGKK
jgi:hypothetical protein